MGNKRIRTIGSKYIIVNKWRKIDFIYCRLTRDFFKQKNIGQFWINVQNEYPNLAEEALKILIPFSTIYLRENGFSHKVKRLRNIAV